MPLSRRRFFQTAGLAALLPAVRPRMVAVEASAEAAAKLPQNLPTMVGADGKLRFDYGKETMVYPGGLQPFILCTRQGTLIVQAQATRKPVATSRMHYPSAIDTVISRDGGKTWTVFPLPPGDNGLNAEGGWVQLRDGTILGLDTYVTPGTRPGQGLGQLYTSTDDYRTLQGPEEITFDLPGVDFYASKDDGGRPHNAERAHRRIIELPGGDLLTTLYGQWEGDRTPSTYEPRMMKARVVLVRSKDRGRSWKLIATIAVDPAVGTEGFDEPAIARVPSGAHAGRILCLMRTGRNLYESYSDDEGATWSPAKPRIFAGLDVDRTELWVDMFRGYRGHSGKLLDENNPDELRGAVVDPDLIALKSGLLVTAFGVRIPQKACWPHAEHPWNGNYLAVSPDGGETWPNVIRLTSGIPTTHYMGVEELPEANKLFVTYDYGFWGNQVRYAYGRTVQITVKAS